MDNNLSIIRNKKAQINGEANEIIKFMRGIDLYEYLVKVQVIYLLHILTEVDKSLYKESKIMANISKVIKHNMKRPSFGHWVSLLRDCCKLNVLGDEGFSRELYIIVKSSEEIVQYRNQFAHGVTPTTDEAREANRKLTVKIYDFIDFYDKYLILHKVEEIIPYTPLCYSITEVFNGIKNEREDSIICEFLDYNSGERLICESDPKLDDYFRRSFNLSVKLNSFLISSLLQDYFPREYWEESIVSEISRYGKVFIYGDAGVGKTTLVARIAEMYNCEMYRFSVTNKTSLSAIEAVKQLYESYRLRVGSLPPLPSYCTKDNMIEYLEILLNSYKSIMDKNEGEEFVYVFDGLDELPKHDFDEFIELLSIFNNWKLNMVFSSRNVSLGKSIEKAVGSMGEVHLKPLTELELQKWFRSYNTNIQYPSDSLIKEIYRSTEGNMLYLKCIPIFKSENEYFHYLKEIPNSIENLFEEILDKYDDSAVRALTLIAIIPNGCSEVLIRNFFGLSRDQYREIIFCIRPVLREISDKTYVLFHAKFEEFLRKELKFELEETLEKLLNEIDEYEPYITPLTEIPKLFEQANCVKGLVKWMDKYINSIEDWIRKDRRFNILLTMMECFTVVSKLDMTVFFTNLTKLEALIYKNFLVVAEWRLFVPLKNYIHERFEKKDLEDYPGIRLAYAASHYSLEEYDKALDILLDLKGYNGLDSVNYLRLLDFMGLTYNRLALIENAIECYTEIIEAVGDKADSIWMGIALSNRGRIFSRQHKKEGYEDICRAIKSIKSMIGGNSRIENDYDITFNDLWSMNMLFVRYDNFLESYMLNYNQAFADVYDDLDRHVSRMESLLQDLKEKYPYEMMSYTTTGRSITDITEYYLYKRNFEKVSYYIKLTEQCYLSKYNRDRLQLQKDILTKVTGGEEWAWRGFNI